MKTSLPVREPPRLTNMQSRHRSPQSVLYVEDNADDFLLFKLASKKCGTPFSLRHAADGEQAIDYLSGAGNYADREEHPFPDLVLLDLKMLRLSWLRSAGMDSVQPGHEDPAGRRPGRVILWC